MMTREERAKQFMSFDAMKGLKEALLDREERHTRVERHDISDEQIALNSSIIAKLSKGMVVSLECYCAFHDITKRGVISEVNIPLKFIRLNEEKVFFEDIYKIKIVDM